MVRILTSGQVDFADDLDKVGGTKSLAREPYARNLWAIMSKFNVLPTDKRFQDLTEMQVSLLIEEMNIDSQFARGKDPLSDDYSYDETFDEDYELSSEEEQESVAKQLEAMRPDKLKQSMDVKVDNLDDEEEQDNADYMVASLKAERERKLRELGLLSDNDTISDEDKKDPLLDDEDIDTF